MASAREHVRQLIVLAGDNPLREGLAETPRRFIEAWLDWTRGYNQDPADVLKVFEDGSCDEMVFQESIPFWSLCEHHLAPFFGVAHIGYIPHLRIVGLSKLARLTDVFARRLQVQERLTTQIADALMKHVQPEGVGVVIQCRHSCIESRGVAKHGSVTTTQALRGSIKDNAPARAEFLGRVQAVKVRI